MTEDSDVRRRTALEMDEMVESNPTPSAAEPGNNAKHKVSNLVPGGPFATSNFFIRFLYHLAIFLKTPWWNSIDSLVAVIVLSRKSPQFRIPILACGNDISLFLIILKSVLFSVLVIVTSPFALIGFLLLIPLQLIRPRSYCYIAPHQRCKPRAHPTGSYTEFDSDVPNQDLPLIRSSRSSLNMMSTNNKLLFTIVTANLCLMPKFVAYINNLSTSTERIKKISNYFIDGIMSKLAGDNGPVDDDIVFGNEDNASCVNNSAANICRNSSDNLEEIADDDDEAESVSTLWSVTSKEKVVSDVLITPADFLCLQEVFERSAISKLLEGLRNRYPYIVYDVSWPIHDKVITILTSGLLIASRYKFIDISFKAYKDGHKDDKLACKGLLMTKVYLGKSADGEDMVGYLSNTHLQAWSTHGASKARCKQLQSINNWLNNFVQESSKRKADSTEKIIFNVIAGDFNFDRVSHFDKNEQRSEILQNYKDPCIDDSGIPFNWVIGTELVQTRLHDDCVKTPSRLHKMLVSELERSQYVASTQPNQPTSTAATDRCEDGRRKIDYILYRDCPDVKTTVKDFKFYTGLTTLTDHLPIGMSFMCEVHNENELLIK